MIRILIVDDHNTVSSYRSNILEKLHLHNTAELMRYAVDHHLVE